METRENYIRNNIIICAISNCYCAKPRRLKFATLVIIISGLRCSFKILDRISEWDR